MEAADDEIEALSSIWDGVRVEKMENSRKIWHKIKSLEDESTSASVLLECTVFEGYPSTSPSVQLSNPRGIGEPEFRELCRLIQKRIEENEGEEMPIICEIFQTCTDYLSEHQHLNVDCSICLRNLSESPIIVTNCDHFMHSSCFSRFLTECSNNFRKEIEEAKRVQPNIQPRVDTNILCPVCRETLTDRNPENPDGFEAEIRKMIKNVKKTEKSIEKPKRRRSSCTGEEEVKEMMKIWRIKQLKLSEIYAKQQENGGIIDVEEDKKRRQFFIPTGNLGILNSDDVGGSSEDVEAGILNSGDVVGHSEDVKVEEDVNLE